MDGPKTQLVSWILVITALISKIVADEKIEIPFAAVETDVQLSISFANLPNGDDGPIFKLLLVTYTRPIGCDVWRKVWHSDIAPGPNPTSMLVSYTFGIKQFIMFKLYKIKSPTSEPNEDQVLGYTECSLGELVTRGERTLPLYREDTFTQDIMILELSKVTIAVANVSQDVIHMALEARNLEEGTEPYVEIYKEITKDQYQLVYKTEVVHNTRSPKWKSFDIYTKELHDAGNLKFKCWDDDRGIHRDLIGEYITTVGKLSNNINIPLNNGRRRTTFPSIHDVGSPHFVQIVEFEFQKKPFAFITDFIKHGWSINWSIIIDFRQSNDNLHHSDPSGTPNEYELLLRSLVNVMEDYETDKSFFVYGLPAKYPSGGAVPPNFDLNSADDIKCVGVEGVLDAYKKALSTMEFEKSANFALYIRAVVQMAKAFSNQPKNYYVLLILINGEIEDLLATKIALKEQVQQPVSVIVLGIGDRRSENLEKLNDEKVLRDTVRYIPLKKFNTYSAEDIRKLLAKDVFGTVAAQVVSYAQSHNVHFGKLYLPD